MNLVVEITLVLLLGIILGVATSNGKGMNWLSFSIWLALTGFVKLLIIVNNGGSFRLFAIISLISSLCYLFIGAGILIFLLKKWILAHS